MITLEQNAAIHSANRAITNPTQKRWIRFFGVLLPGAALSFSLITQLLAYELRDINPFRSSLDVIAAAAEQVPENARWVIFGDSLTQHVLIDYSLGTPDVVANLTTHAGAGMPSMYLLLRRYLGTHNPPEAIMLALTPEVLTNIPSTENEKSWLAPTFRRPDERAWLSQFYPVAQQSSWPAAINLKETIFDHLTGLFAPKHNRLIVGANQPSTEIVPEPAIVQSDRTVAEGRERASRKLGLGSTRTVLSDICHLARKANITVHLVIAPMPVKLHQSWEASGDFARLMQQINEIMSNECDKYSVFDTSAELHIPNFDEGGTHINGFGWENQYALVLRNYILSQDMDQKISVKR